MTAIFTVLLSAAETTARTSWCARCIHDSPGAGSPSPLRASARRRRAAAEGS